MVASTASSPKATTTKAQPVSPEAGGGSGGGSSSPGPATTDPSAASPPTANGKMTSNNVVVDKTGKAGLAKKPVHVKVSESSGRASGRPSFVSMIPTAG